MQAVQLLAGMDEFEQFMLLAAQLDRESLDTAIRLSDSTLGQAILKQVTPERYRTNVDRGLAMLKLTAFFLAELDKLCDLPGTQI